MLTKPNFQRLLDVCKATEQQFTTRFDMHEVYSKDSCGTVGCMIGNYNVMVDREVDRFSDGWSYQDNRMYEDWEYFGITQYEYNWLFTEGVVFGRKNYALRYITPRRNLKRVTKEEALSRLRKFIYYKMHKHEMIVDEKYGVREEARQKEGDNNFVNRASKKAAELVAV